MMSTKTTRTAFDNKQLSEQLQRMKSKFNKQSKTVKQLRKHRNADTKKMKTDICKELEEERKKCAALRQKLDKSENKNKVLKSQLQHLKSIRRKTKQTSDPLIGELRKENRDLRMKLLKDTLVTINKQKQWYNRSIKIFKNNQQKWIDKQQAIFKDKKLIIKYVFMDDIKYIKQYQKPYHGKNGKRNHSKSQFRNKVKFKMQNGGETTKKGVEIIVLDSEISDDRSKKDDEIDKFVNELMEEFEVTKHGIDNENDMKCPLDNENDFREKMLYLQKRVNELEKHIKKKDKIIDGLRCNHMYVNKMDNCQKKDSEFTDENEYHEKKQIRLTTKKEYGKLNIKIESNSNVMKREVHIESAVKNSQFLLRDTMEKLKKENEALRLQMGRMQEK